MSADTPHAYRAAFDALTTCAPSDLPHILRAVAVDYGPQSGTAGERRIARAFERCADEINAALVDGARADQ